MGSILSRVLSALRRFSPRLGTPVPVLGGGVGGGALSTFRLCEVPEGIARCHAAPLLLPAEISEQDRRIARKSRSLVQIFTQYSVSYGKIFPPGGMAEWFKATDLKSVVAARSPGVRIPLPPPRYQPGLLVRRRPGVRMDPGRCQSGRLGSPAK